MSTYEIKIIKNGECLYTCLADGPSSLGAFESAFQSGLIQLDRENHEALVMNIATGLIFRFDVALGDCY